jgi:hypothetical protein
MSTESCAFSLMTSTSKLRVHGPAGEALFVQRKGGTVDLSLMDPLTRAETETLEMLYRHQREFAVGHGIAVHATLPAALAERATQVETEWVPCFEVPQQTTRSAADDANLAGLTLDMKDLAELPKADLIANLRLIAAAYQALITAEAAKLTVPAERLADHQDAAQRAVVGCQRAHERITAGIDLIASDPLAEAAFRFANRAMWQQRIHSIFVRKIRAGRDGERGADRHDWRPPLLAPLPPAPRLLAPRLLRCAAEPQLASVPVGLRAAEPAESDRSAPPGPQPPDRRGCGPAVVRHRRR